MILITIGLLLILFAVFVKYRFSYWRRFGIKQLPPSFPFGNCSPLFTKSDTFGHTFKTIYDRFKRDHLPIGGYYFSLKPELMLICPDLIKCVLTKDFANFATRGTYIDEQNDPLSANLFSLAGGKWKALRAKLSPAFTSGKMKMMFPTLLGCCTELEAHLREVQAKGEACNVKEVSARFTMNIIGSCAFGIECNCLKHQTNDFWTYGTRAMNGTSLDMVRQMFAVTFPEFMKLIRIPGMNPGVSKFFRNIVAKTVSYREQNDVNRNDFMHLLIQLKNKGQIDDDEALTQKIADQITVDQIAAQCFLFFVAGYETSSTTMTFALYEMAINVDIQTKLRNEILAVLNKHNSEVSYESVMEMHYLDQVVAETLRKYPPLPFLNREATTDYRLPDTEIVIKKGTPVVISLEGLHWDPDYYPKPEVWDPDRFTETEKAKRPPYSYIPFGEGPRVCIGVRFGLMQTKIGLVTILKNFQCTLNEKTLTPLKMSPSNFMTSAEGGIWLNLNKLTN